MKKYTHEKKYLTIEIFCFLDNIYWNYRDVTYTMMHSYRQLS